MRKNIKIWRYLSTVQCCVVVKRTFEFFIYGNKFT